LSRSNHQALSHSKAQGIDSDSIPSTRLLTPAQTAQFLGIPQGTLAQWRSQRRGPPFVKFEGRLVRYRTSDLQKYLALHLVEPVAS